MVISFPSAPRIAFVHRDTGEFLGWSVSFEIPSRAAYVVFKDGKWHEVAWVQ